MEQEKKKSFLKEYIITSIISLIVGGTLFCLFYFFVEKGGVAGASSAAGMTGLILVCIGLLMFVSKQGFFDFAGYGFRQLGSMIFKKNAAEYHDYPEYLNYKKEQRKNISNNYIVTLIAGALFLLGYIILKIVFLNLK